MLKRVVDDAVVVAVAVVVAQKLRSLSSKYWQEAEMDPTALYRRSRAEMTDNPHYRPPYHCCPYY